MSNGLKKIIINTDYDATNKNMRATPTVEDMYDLYHHTHNIEDLVGAVDIPGDIGQKINENKKAIQDINDKINSGDIITGLTFEEIE